MFTIGTEDLAAGLSQVLLVLVILGFIASVVGIRARKSGNNAIALTIASSVSFGWIVLCGIGVLFIGYQNLFAPTVDVSANVTSTQPPEFGTCGGIVPPVDTATVVCGWPDGTTLQIAGLAFGLRSLLFFAALLGLVLFAVPGLAVRLVTTRAEAGEPFDPRVARGLGILAIIVLVLGIMHDLLLPISQTLAAHAALGKEDPSGPPVFELSVQLWPFGAALVLAAVGVVFRHGYRLQRETEGLV
ncbi:hypothetical protein L2X99_17520 [Microbacterium sp. KUDC0406]|uniref:hypothetical protein n=1 Tax=Microbacterium sp. KUDC0406 TaxID=2909588 RepID=UPI001F401A09|nr:hypothetical protein [Microbacterium sp. KUDC0406]UJP10121.1 hypothetical protein L2X99_17520 [Microbacterium sp. KUDC0406]